MKNLVSKTKNIKVGLCRRTQKKTCHKSLHFCTNEVGVISRQEASPVLNNNNTNMIQLWWWLLSLGEAGGAGPPSGLVLSLPSPVGPRWLTEMSLRVMTSLALVALSGCDLDHQAGAAAIADLEGEMTNIVLWRLCTKIQNIRNPPVQQQF